MIYTYRKQLLIILAIIVLVVGGGITWAVMRKKATPTVAKPSYSVSVKGMDSTPTPLSDTTKQMVQSYIDAQLTAKHGPGTYQAAIRQGSYKRVITPEGGIITTMLVDVSSTKETYLFTRTGGDNSQYGTSYVRCAPEGQQMVHPSLCKDMSDD